MTFDQDALWAIAPRAQPTYRRMLRIASTVGPEFEIVGELRTAHFLAQVLHETAGLTRLVENLNYSAERLTEVKGWRKHFPTLEAAQPYAMNPRALANKVYGNRADLGNMQPEDGWRFIGRGLLQLTGRANYARVGAAMRLDLVGEPELALTPEHGLAIACCIWQLLGCNAGADADDVQRVTRAINGGLIGLPDRIGWLQKTRKVVCDAE